MALLYHTTHDIANHFIFQFFFLFGCRDTPSIIPKMKKILVAPDLRINAEPQSYDYKSFKFSI
jgi:hypothetical protein